MSARDCNSACAAGIVNRENPSNGPHSQGSGDVIEFVLLLFFVAIISTIFFSKKSGKHNPRMKLTQLSCCIGVGLARLWPSPWSFWFSVRQTI
jgi:hypothetical protein